MVRLIRSSTCNALLRAGQVLLVVAILLLGSRATTRPALTRSASDRTARPESPPVAKSTGRALDWYAPIWQRDLRQPPIPAVVEEPPPKSTAPPPPLPQLLGTFIESQARWAHFVTGQGRSRVCRIDQPIDGYRIVAIEPGRAQLAVGTDLHWVEVPRATPLGQGK